MSIEIISSTEPISVTADADLDNKAKVVEKNDDAESVENADDADLDESSDEVENSNVEDENDNEESETDEEDKEVKPKKKGGFQKRLERFQRKLDDKDREIDFYKSQMQKPNDLADDARTQKTAKNNKPLADDFESHSDFIEALTDWKVEQKISDAESKKKQAEFKTEQSKNFASFQNKVSDFAKENKDFHDVIGDVDDINLSVGLQDAIITSEIGAKVMYELSKNRDELLRINKLSPLAQAREIGKLEAKFSVNKEVKQEKKQPSAAAAPIKTIGTKTASIKKSIYDSNLSMSEYEALRNEQIKARKRA